MLIRTVDGIIYALDTKNHIISGGVFREKTKYLFARMIIGAEGYVLLLDGREVNLPLVECYV